ncbi:MAG: hypothetical protein DMF55_11065 [Acidobacteria bacterium]|nr:MAG: hypothetical protein DMF55_11065 [Acidobacteriota bacterium]
MPDAPPKLYLVDAMSNIHRAYHAIQRLSTTAGRPTNAIYGFVTMLRKMLREHAPDYLAVAWDGPERTVRHQAYKEYKANRPMMADDLRTQLPAIRSILQAYRVPVLELPGYEADDVIGTLAKKASAMGFDVVIVTADKDMLQLVGPRVRVFHTGREKFLDEAGVREFFGVAPGQVADVLALMGDSVDNIPGVPRVGEVTAKKWIAEYGDLPTLLARADEVKGKVGESLREHKDDALISRSLVEIPTDLEIPFEPDAFRRTTADAPKLRQLFVELEFHSLAAEIHDEAAVAPEISAVRRKPGEPFALDLAAPVGVALLRAKDTALLAVSDGRTVEIAEESRPEIAARWRALDRPGSTVTIADAKSLDSLLAREGGAIAADVYDVCLAQYVLAPGVGSSDFEVMAFQRLGQKVTPNKEAGIVSCALPEGYAVETADRWLGERASGTLELARRLRLEMEKRPALEKIYREIERPLTPVLARMELAGIAVDLPYLAGISTRMERELRALEERIWQEAGEQFNVNSPVKLGQILFEKMKYPVGRKTAKTRVSSTGVEVLTELAEQGFPIARLVIEYREISKLKGTYVDALPELADENSRVHSSFHQTVAATGRLSSSDPNLQNREQAHRRRLLADRAPDPRPPLGRPEPDRGFRAERRHPSRDRREDLRGLARPRHPGDAVRGEADQLRAPLRDGGVHARQGSGGLDSGGEELHRVVLRAVPGGPGNPGWRPRRGALDERGDDALRPRPPDPGHPRLQRAGPRQRRAHGLERALPGIGRGHHQDRDGPARSRARGVRLAGAHAAPGPRRARPRSPRRRGRRNHGAGAPGDGGSRAIEGAPRRRGRIGRQLARGEVTCVTFRYTSRSSQ